MATKKAMGISISIEIKEVEGEGEFVLDFQNVSEKDITCAIAAAMHQDKNIRQIIKKAVMLSMFTPPPTDKE